MRGMRYSDYSIIIPTYNRPNFLRNTVNSILVKTNLKYIKEIIISDDSEDAETKYCALELKKKQKKIRYYKNLLYRKGPCGNRNNGLDHASGDLIIILDDDDEIIEDFTTEVLDFFNKNLNYDVLFTDFIRSDNYKKAGYGIRKQGEVSYENWLCSKIRGDFLIISKKDFLKNHRFHDEFFGLERIFWLELIKNTDARIYYLKKAFCLKRVGHESILSSIDKNALKWVYTYDSYIRLFSKEYEKYCPKCISIYINRKAYLELIMGKRRDALFDIIKSINSNKLNIEAYVLFVSILFPKRIVKWLKDIYLRTRG